MVTFPLGPGQASCAAFLQTHDWLQLDPGGCACGPVSGPVRELTICRKEGTHGLRSWLVPLTGVEPSLADQCPLRLVI